MTPRSSASDTPAVPRPPAVAPLADGLRVETFPIEPDASSDGRAAAFTRSVAQGFYEGWLSSANVERWQEAFVEDGQVLTGVYVDPGHAALEPWGGALERLGHGPEHPVGTFVEWDKTLNLGAGLLPARLISGVTVNPGFRRRGILSHMMTARLAAAVDDGLPVAALTVSEGGIYGRFGFGAATREQRIRLNTTPAGDGFALRGAPTGTVLPVDPTRLGDVLAEVFAVQHARERGSVGRHAAYRNYATARWSRDDAASWDRAVRGIVHVREDGEIGGCAVFRFSGWDSEPPTMELMDIVSRDATSRLELWRHLAEMDLVRRVTFSRAPLEDPLSHALVNPRAREVVGETDVLWVRVLDVAQCLQARDWGADGQMLLQVEDRLGIVDGAYRVEVHEGAAGVEALVGEPSPSDVGHRLPVVTLDAETLGSLLLGDVSVRALHAVGRLAVDGGATEEQELLARLSASWDLPTAPHCATHF
ncbi:GNAT family N-acetyltransferase [Nesterenkonia sp. K-15-9-6]|uniref:GNAT family N-acetyltransferase n=1 Tax=Nesterenkonia sp. K-15-9-6 TaxID=3093918 RepID=UPI004043BF4D